MGFRPSEVAAAVAAAVAGEEHAVDIDKACTHRVHEVRATSREFCRQIQCDAMQYVKACTAWIQIQVVGLQLYLTCAATELGTPAQVREPHLQPWRLMLYLLLCAACWRLQERVSRCLEAIQATVALLAPGTVPAQPLKAEGPSSSRSRASSSSANVPRSPTGVLDAGCLSYRSDDAAAAASHASSAWRDEDDDCSPAVCSKRRKTSR